MKQDSEREIEHYVSTRVLMEVLEISRSTVYRLMTKGMPSIMVGSVHRFPMEQVVMWLEENYPPRGQ
jgi:excisionase family DNA binding protein